VTGRSAIPACIALRPIDDAARDGQHQLVFGGGLFALVRWNGEGWAFGSGVPLEAEPTHYHAQKQKQGREDVQNQTQGKGLQAEGSHAQG
jgi:hypothetical protein